MYTSTSCSKKTYLQKAQKVPEDSEDTSTCEGECNKYRPLSQHEEIKFSE